MNHSLVLARSDFLQPKNLRLAAECCRDGGGDFGGVVVEAGLGEGEVGEDAVVFGNDHGDEDFGIEIVGRRSGRPVGRNADGDAAREGLGRDFDPFFGRCDIRGE